MLVSTDKRATGISTADRSIDEGTIIMLFGTNHIITDSCDRLVFLVTYSVVDYFELQLLQYGWTCIFLYGIVTPT